jgi:hypothetical protein
VIAVAALDEPPEQNPLASQVKQEQDQWEAVGLGKRRHKCDRVTASLALNRELMALGYKV